MTALDLDQAPATHDDLSAILPTFAVTCFGFALAGLFIDRDTTVMSQYFLRAQDAPVLAAMFVSLRVVMPHVGATAAPRYLQRLPGLGFSLAIALVVVAVGYFGARYVQLGYSLSLDEFWANFDARIFAAGHLIGPVAP